jgi:hypothetical protein
MNTIIRATRLAALMSLMIFLFNEGLSAKYVQTCKVKYKKEYGWSQYYTVEVTFMSGAELNKATSTFGYDGFSTYAIVFWGQGAATVIKISSYTGCGTEVKQSCIANNIINLAGKDQDGDIWEVCTKDYCF